MNGKEMPDKADGNEQQPALLMPPFYGTGEMLVWETRPLLDAVRHDRLFKEFWGASLDDAAYAAAVRDVYEPAFRRLADRLVDENTVDARGYYGFFPVIVDGRALIILDPADYHTERAVLEFPADGTDGANAVRDRIRPEGDFVAIAAGTLGPLLDTAVGACAPDTKELLTGLADHRHESQGIRSDETDPVFTS